jgi:hypothetical protein
MLDHRIREDDIEGRILELEVARIALYPYEIRERYRGSGKV